MKRKELMSELSKLTAAELKRRGAELAEELMKLRFRKSGGQLEQSHRLRTARRDLARVATVLRRTGQTAQADGGVE